ncbi:hypothetical protein [Nocardia suismassiliense]|uniref:hypothetical protein n=1 Tax=Nocardia suismassiliense TaxID=2077092 RepID=UPI00131F1C56|nr:hypothetical protein [Nocardia suismassiliense]
MGKHSAPRNNVVPARLAVLSTATLIGLAVSTQGGAGQAIAEGTNSTSGAGDDVWIAPPKQVVSPAVVPAAYQQHARPNVAAPVRAERPAPRSERPAPKPGGTAKPGPAPKGDGSPLGTLVDSLATGSAALPAPLRTVLEALAKEVGPVLAKGLIQLITSANPPSPKGRHAAPAPAAPAADYAEDADADSDVVDNSDAGGDTEETGDPDAGDGSDETSVGIYSGAAGDSGDAETAEATDDADAAGYADDPEITDYSEEPDAAGYADDGDDTGYTEDGDDTSVADYADVVDAADADADWKPLALEPSPVG